MKKIVILLLSIFLVGCGQKEAVVETPEDNNTPNVLSLKYQGTDISCGDFFPLDQIAGEYAFSEIPSCAFDGIDKVYTFDDLEIVVCNKDEKDVVYSVYFLTPDISTNEGLALADEASKVEEIYGPDYELNLTQYTYHFDNCDLLIIVDNDFVVSIEYQMDTTR